MPVSSLESYIPLVAREIVAVQQRMLAQGRTEDAAALTRALPVLAGLEGISLREMRARYAPPMPPVSPETTTSYIEPITRSLLSLYVQRHSENDRRAARDLSPLLPVLVQLNAQYRQPLFGTLLQQSLLPSRPPAEHRAAMSVLQTVAAEQQAVDCLLPVLQTGLQDDNWLVRAACAGLIALSGKEGDQDALRPLLLRSLADSRLRPGYRPEHLEVLPRSTAHARFLLAELRENDPAGYAWIVCAVAIGETLSGSLPPMFVEELSARIGSDSWMVGMTATAVLQKCGQTALLMQRLKEQLLAAEQGAVSPAEIRALGRMAVCVPQIPALLVRWENLWQISDLPMQAALLEAMEEMLCCGSPTLAVEIRSLLQSVASSRQSLLSPLAAAVLRRDTEAQERPLDLPALVLQRVREGEASGSDRSAASGSSSTPPERRRTTTAALLTIRNTWRDDPTTTRDARRLLLLQTLQSCVEGYPTELRPALFFQEGELLALFPDSLGTALDTAVETARLLRRRGVLNPTMGIHCGEVVLERTDAGQWRLTGRGLEAVLTLARYAEPGYLLLSPAREPGSTLSPTEEQLTEYTRCNGQWASAVVSHGVLPRPDNASSWRFFTLYSAAHGFGQAGLPASLLRRTKERRVSRMPALLQVGRMLVLLVLLTVIGGAGWTVYQKRSLRSETSAAKGKQEIDTQKKGAGKKSDTSAVKPDPVTVNTAPRPSHNEPAKPTDKPNKPPEEPSGRTPPGAPLRLTASFAKDKALDQGVSTAPTGQEGEYERQVTITLRGEGLEYVELSSGDAEVPNPSPEIQGKKSAQWILAVPGNSLKVTLKYRYIDGLEEEKEYRFSAR